MYYTKNITEVTFSEEIFFYGLLPPMIFAGGYNMKKEDFERNFKYIFLFGFLGTVCSCAIIFGLTYLIDQLGWIKPVGSEPFGNMTTGLIMRFSSTTSASDSVAALTLISPIDQPKLYSIVFGESMANDAVSIILF